MIGEVSTPTSSHPMVFSQHIRCESYHHPSKEKERYIAPTGIWEIGSRIALSSGSMYIRCSRYPSIDMVKLMAVVVN